MREEQEEQQEEEGLALVYSRDGDVLGQIKFPVIATLFVVDDKRMQHSHHYV